ncbi:hypothetical protein LTR37_006681 [Vermiconidia calcicola]|uniref:Uncharacterized protein n=1 Tax=Vermiconidia calcicola TaxID=1690605 RepID=A0ACC3NHM4_9PEZI|nr:hypothetical protein LTR37_006681 [Vermiconidia calcicola]
MSSKKGNRQALLQTGTEPKAYQKANAGCLHNMRIIADYSKLYDRDHDDAGDNRDGRTLLELETELTKTKAAIQRGALLLEVAELEKKLLDPATTASNEALSLATDFVMRLRKLLSNVETPLIRSIKTELDTVTATNDKLVKNLKSQREEFMARESEAAATIDKQNEEMQTMCNYMLELAQKQQKAKEMVDGLINTQEQEHSQLSLQLDAANNANNRLKQTEAGLGRKVSDLQRKVIEVRAENSTTNADTTAINDRVARLEAENNGCRNYAEGHAAYRAALDSAWIDLLVTQIFRKLQAEKDEEGNPRWESAKTAPVVEKIRYLLEQIDLEAAQLPEPERKQKIAGSKVIVFSEFLSALDVLEVGIKQQLGLDCFRYDGTCSA